MEENRLSFEPPEQFSLCVWVRERLPDHLEGYLDALTAEAIRAHLAVCYLCQREFTEMQQTIRLVEHLPFVEPGRDFAPRVMAAIQATQGAESPPGYFFQAPVVEMETETLDRLSAPRTTTGRLSRGMSGLNGLGELHYPTVRERIMSATALTALLAGLALSPLGRLAIEGQGAPWRWIDQGVSTLGNLPVVGGMVEQFAQAAYS